MSRWGIAVLVMILAGCSSKPMPILPATDQAGNVYPRTCFDMSKVKAPLILVTTAQMTEVAKGPPKPGHVRLGHWRSEGSSWGTIYVDPTGLSLDQIEDVIRHEQCHAKLFRETGNPQFHPE